MAHGGTNSVSRKTLKLWQSKASGHCRKILGKAIATKKWPERVVLDKGPRE